MIHTALLIQIHKFGKILVILINDSNNSPIFTVLVVVALTKKKKENEKFTGIYNKT